MYIKYNITCFTHNKYHLLTYIRYLVSNGILCHHGNFSYEFLFLFFLWISEQYCHKWWMSSSIGQNPTISCHLLFSCFRLHPLGLRLSLLRFRDFDIDIVCVVFVWVDYWSNMHFSWWRYWVKDVRQRSKLCRFRVVVFYFILFWDCRTIGKCQSIGGSLPPHKFSVKKRGSGLL